MREGGGDVGMGGMGDGGMGEGTLARRSIFPCFSLVRTVLKL